MLSYHAERRHMEEGTVGSLQELRPVPGQSERTWDLSPIVTGTRILPTCMSLEAVFLQL